MTHVHAQVRGIANMAIVAMFACIAWQPVAAQVFQDDFSGDDLAEAWKVENPDRSAYQVEGGNLLLLAKDVVADEDVATAALPNRLVVDTELPDGDWTMTVRFSAEFQTARESLVFGLMDGEDNYVLADIRTGGDSNRGWQLNAELTKRSGRSESRFTDAIARLRCNICGKERTFRKFAATIAMPIEAQIAKTGREYTLQVRTGGHDGENAWRRIATVVAINPPVRPVLFARQWEKTDGESAFRIDYVGIGAPD